MGNGQEVASHRANERSVRLKGRRWQDERLYPRSQSSSEPYSAVCCQGDWGTSSKTGRKSHDRIHSATVGHHSEPIPKHVSIKESVFPFRKFAGVDIVLGPEMRSTGEVMGIAADFPMAFAKSQLSAGVVLPTSGNVFISLNSRHKHRIASIATRLNQLGFTVLATPGTAVEIEKNGIPVTVVKKIAEGSPNLIDYLKNEDVSLIINTPNGKGARTDDEGRIRAAAVQHGVPCITTLAALMQRSWPWKPYDKVSTPCSVCKRDSPSNRHPRDASAAFLRLSGISQAALESRLPGGTFAELSRAL